jgi:hypothetical protein
MRKREIIRRETFKLATPFTPKTQIAYPKETSYEYVTSVGNLLGYPCCCVKNYVKGRLSKSYDTERTASDQLKTSL